MFPRRQQQQQQQHGTPPSFDSLSQREPTGAVGSSIDSHKNQQPEKKKKKKTAKKSGLTRSKSKHERAAAVADEASSSALSTGAAMSAPSSIEPIKKHAEKSLARLLSSKSVQPGMSLLGAVISVSDVSATLTLPNSVRAHVRRSEVSDWLHDRLVQSRETDHTDDGQSMVHGSDDVSLPRLQDLLPVGTLVACKVVDQTSLPGADIDGQDRVDDPEGDEATTGSAGNKRRRRSASSSTGSARTGPLAVTLRGSQINGAAFSSRAQLLANMTLIACVAGVQDRGAVIDIGVPGARCFWRGDPVQFGLRDGQPVFAVLPDSLPANPQTVIRVTLLGLTPVSGGDGDHAQQQPLLRPLVDARQQLTLEQLTAGQLVRATVRRVLARPGGGLVVSFFGVFQAAVHERHLGPDPFLASPESCSFKVDRTYTFRVLSVDSNTKDIALTAKPHLLRLRRPIAAQFSDQWSSTVYDDGVVLRVAPKAGLYLNVAVGTPSSSLMNGDANTDNQSTSQSESSSSSASSSGPSDQALDGVARLTVFVPLSYLDSKQRPKSSGQSDNPKQQLASSKMAVGSTHQCYVSWINWLEGVAQGSMRTEDVNRLRAKPQELVPGSVVTGQVTRVTPGAVFVRVSDGVSGRCTKQHFGAVPVSGGAQRRRRRRRASLAEAEPGDRFTFRVLSHADSKGRQLDLTHKRPLVTSPLPPLTAYGDAQPGAPADGMVTKVAEFGAIVSFYNGVHGLLPARSLQTELRAVSAGAVSSDPTKQFDPSDSALEVGQCVRVYIVSAQPDAGKLILSLTRTGAQAGKERRRPGSAAATAVQGPNVGTVVRGAVERPDTDEAGSAGDEQLPDDRVVFEGGGQGHLPLAHYSDHKTHCAGVRAHHLALPHRSFGTPVLALRRTGPSVLVTAKPSLIAAAEQNRLPATVDECRVGRLLAGYVKSVTRSTLFVGFLGELTGLVRAPARGHKGGAEAGPPRVTLGDDTGDDNGDIDNVGNDEPKVDWRQLYGPGDSVAVRVTAINRKRGQLNLRLVDCADDSPDDPRALNATVTEHGLDSAQRLASWFAEASLIAPGGDADRSVRPGQVVSAVLTSVQEYGCMFDVTLTDDAAPDAGPVLATGFAVAAHTGKSCPPSAVGQEFVAVVLDHDPVTNVVDLSLRRDLVSEASLAVVGRSAEANVKAKGKTKAKRKGKVDGDGDRQGGAEASPAGDPYEVLLAKEQYLVLKRLARPLTGSGDQSGMIVFATQNGIFNGPVPAAAGSGNAPPALFNLFQVGETVHCRSLAGLSDSLVRSGRVIVRLQPKSLSLALLSADSNASNLKVGSLVRCQVIALGPFYAGVAVGSQRRGRIHISRIVDGQQSWPLSGLHHKQWIVAKIASLGSQSSSGVKRKKHIDDGDLADNDDGQPGTDDADGGRSGPRVGTILLDARPSEVSRPGEPPLEPDLSIGAVLVGWVDRASSDAVWIHVGPQTRGRLFVLDAGARTPADAALFPEGLVQGRAVRVRVVGRDQDRGTLDFALIQGYPLRSDSGDDDGGAVTPVHHVAKDAVVVCRISRVSSQSGGVFVQLSGHLYGRASLCDVDEDDALQLKSGQFRLCRILNEVRPGGGDVFGNDDDRVDVSLRAIDVADPSRPPPPPLTSADVQVGQLVSGVVRRTAPHSGCFVSLSRVLVARALVSNMSDKFIREQDLVTQFPPGKRVMARVLRKKGSSVELSMKASDVASVGFPDLRVNDVVQGHVKRIESFGLFIRLDQSQLDGLCHRTEACSPEQSLVDLFPVGSPVEAKIIKLDPSKQKISLSILKAKQLVSGEGGDAANGGQGDVANAGTTQSRKRKGASALLYSSDVVTVDGNHDANHSGSSDTSSSDRDTGSSDRESVESEQASEQPREQDESEDSSATDGGERTASSPGTVVKSPFESRGLFDNENSTRASERRVAAVTAPASASASVAAGEDRGADGEPPAKKKKSVLGRDDMFAEEEDTARQEQALVAELGDSGDSLSADALERRLVASPNDSALWIQLMALRGSQGDLRGARQIGERALGAIHFREEQERANIWLALLNFEHALGTAETRDAVLKQAARRGDPVNIWLHVASLHEKHGRLDQSEESFKQAVRLRQQSPQAAQQSGTVTENEHQQWLLRPWLEFARFLARNGRLSTMHQLMKQAVRVMPTATDQVALVSAFAQLEYRHGSVERGRTLFEGLLANHPKRLDVWNRYLDMEERDLQNTGVDSVRRLYERLASFKLSSKKMKSVFKRWLRFEKNGPNDPIAIEKVRNRAKQFVEQRQS